MKAIFDDDLMGDAEDIKKRKKLHRRSRSLDDLMDDLSSDDSDDPRLMRNSSRRLSKLKTRYMSVPGPQDPYVINHMSRVHNSCIDFADPNRSVGLTRGRLGARRSIPEGQIADVVQSNFDAQ